MELSPEAARFLSLVKSIALQIHQDLLPDTNFELLTRFGLDGLSDGLAQYRSRQGLTQRTYMIYRIRAAIYSGVAGHKWKTEEARGNYIFLKKTNELLLNFYLSAEAAIKRSVQAEEEDLLHLLGLITIIALLSGRKVRGVELENCVQELNTKNQDFIHYYYDEDLDLAVVSEKIGISYSAAYRMHLQILETLARQIGAKSHRRTDV